MVAILVIVCTAIVALFFLSEILLPILNGTPILPMFRERGALEGELRKGKESVEVKELRRRLKELEEEASERVNNEK